MPETKLSFSCPLFFLSVLSVSSVVNPFHG